MADAPPTLPQTQPRPGVGNLKPVWRIATAYPWHIAAALAAMLVAAVATLAIPHNFQLIIDKGFAHTGGDIGRWFRYLLEVVIVMAVPRLAVQPAVDAVAKHDPLVARKPMP